MSKQLNTYLITNVRWLLVSSASCMRCFFFFFNVQSAIKTEILSLFFLSWFWACAACLVLNLCLALQHLSEIDTLPFFPPQMIVNATAGGEPHTLPLEFRGHNVGKALIL